MLVRWELFFKFQGRRDRVEKNKLFFCLLPFVLAGCAHIDPDMNNKDLTGYQIDYDISNESGQNVYHVNGQEYPLLLRLTGRSANAAYDSYYIVLTSNTELSFKEVDAKFWGSHLTPTEDFVIVEYGLVYE